MSNQPMKWADRAMFHAEPHPNYTETHGVLPKVHLLWMTPDPLGAVAAMCEMYKGNVVRSLADLSDDQRRQALDDTMATHLRAPLEAVKFHFLFDGVDRAFTHQHVRQRTAVYAQESMRFAVVEDLPRNTSLPPTISALPQDDPARVTWDAALEDIGRAYEALVANGIPAEDARGLLPHATATRLHYVTDLRNLTDHAGNRLCTQAQFHWRLVFSQVVNAIRTHANDPHVLSEERWQYSAIANSSLFRPVCYQLNRCPFKASFDRACSIRSRVDAYATAGVPSDKWGEETILYEPDGGEQRIGPIRIEEWLMDDTAARER